MQRLMILLVIGFLAPPPCWAEPAAGRIPGADWAKYADPADAGFDVGRLEQAKATWEGLPSSALLVVADGAVLASWGEVDRRFMCHSVRKSFLTALYGIYWDRGEIELNKTLADLGIDEEPDPLLESEKQARILDILKARSGVFHPAAYAGRTDSRPRGSEGPGRYFAYNNWDFNTAAAILMQETGADVFEAFDEFFARPLGMEDWRLSDGYYHYERDKSRYPAYPFRMSARDAARFGLLFARDGLWGDKRILSRHWVRRSSALYSIDTDIMGYGFMWWVFREPRFERHGMFAALGVGGQLIAVLPDLDMVIVNRANTYEEEGTPMEPMLDLIEQIIDARTGAPVSDPRLVALEEVLPDPRQTRVASEALAEFAGNWAYPPPRFGVPERTRFELRPDDGHLVSYSPHQGTFQVFVQADGTLLQEDSLDVFWPVRKDNGEIDGFADADAVARASVVAAANGDRAQADLILAVPGNVASDLLIDLARGLVDLLTDRPGAAEQFLQALAEANGLEVGQRVNNAGRILADADKPDHALRVYELNTRLFPQVHHTWNALGGMYESLGRNEEALPAFLRSLELEPSDRAATEAVLRLRGPAEQAHEIFR